MPRRPVPKVDDEVMQREALNLVTRPGPYTGMGNLDLHKTDLAKAANWFRSKLSEKQHAVIRADEAARDLHVAMLEAHDAGASLEQISDMLGVSEDVADTWLGSLVRGRANHGEMPAAAYNASRFAA